MKEGRKLEMILKSNRLYILPHYTFDYVVELFKETEI